MIMFPGCPCCGQPEECHIRVRQQRLNQTLELGITDAYNNVTLYPGIPYADSVIGSFEVWTDVPVPNTSPQEYTPQKLATCTFYYAFNDGWDSLSYDPNDPGSTPDAKWLYSSVNSGSTNAYFKSSMVPGGDFTLRAPNGYGATFTRYTFEIRNQMMESTKELWSYGPSSAPATEADFTTNWDNRAGPKWGYKVGTDPKWSYDLSSGVNLNADSGGLFYGGYLKDYFQIFNPTYNTQVVQKWNPVNGTASWQKTDQAYGKIDVTGSTLPVTMWNAKYAMGLPTYYSHNYNGYQVGYKISATPTDSAMPNPAVYWKNLIINGSPAPTVDYFNKQLDGTVWLPFSIGLGSNYMVGQCSEIIGPIDRDHVPLYQEPLQHVYQYDVCYRTTGSGYVAIIVYNTDTSTIDPWLPVSGSWPDVTFERVPRVAGTPEVFYLGGGNMEELCNWWSDINVPPNEVEGTSLVNYHGWKQATRLPGPGDIVYLFGTNPSLNLSNTDPMPEYKSVYVYSSGQFFATKLTVNTPAYAANGCGVVIVNSNVKVGSADPAKTPTAGWNTSIFFSGADGEVFGCTIFGDVYARDGITVNEWSNTIGSFFRPTSISGKLVVEAGTGVIGVKNYDVYPGRFIEIGDASTVGGTHAIGAGTRFTGGLTLTDLSQVTHQDLIDTDRPVVQNSLTCSGDAIFGPFAEYSGAPATFTGSSHLAHNTQIATSVSLQDSASYGSPGAIDGGADYGAMVSGGLTVSDNACSYYVGTVNSTVVYCYLTAGGSGGITGTSTAPTYAQNPNACGVG